MSQYDMLLEDETSSTLRSVFRASSVLRLRIGHVIACCASDTADLPLRASKQVCSGGLWSVSATASTASEQITACRCSVTFITM